MTNPWDIPRRKTAKEMATRNTSLMHIKSSYQALGRSEKRCTSKEMYMNRKCVAANKGDIQGSGPSCLGRDAPIPRNAR